MLKKRNHCFINKDLKPLSIIYNLNFRVDNLCYQTVMHAFYSLVNPSNASLISHYSIERLVHNQFCKKKWEIENNNEIFKILLTIIVSKCKNCKDYLLLLLSTKDDLIVGEEFDSFLGGYYNYYGLAMMFVRDNKIYKYDTNNMISLVDLFIKYIKEFIITNRKQTTNKNNYVSNINPDDYEEFEGQTRKISNRYEVLDAKEFIQ